MNGIAQAAEWHDAPRMNGIVARLMRAVRVSRDYQVEIELTVDCEQLGISLGSDEMSLLAA